MPLHNTFPHSTLQWFLISKERSKKKEAKQNLLAIKRSPREAVNMDQKHRQMYGPGICTAAKQKLGIKSNIKGRELQALILYNLLYICDEDCTLVRLLQLA